MSIYKPVSNLSRRALSLSGSLLNGVKSAVGAKLNGHFGNGVWGKIADTAVQKGLNLATNEITRRVASPISAAAQKLDNRLTKVIRKGLKTFGLNAFDDENFADDALHHAGNLSIRQAWENYKKMQPEYLSRKNFFVLEINDRYAPVKQFNLLATALSFSGVDIQGEAVQVGAVELDKMGANARTTLNLTMLDDEYGTIKRWAENKAQTAAATDGTFLPPAYHAFEVRIVFGSNIANPAYYEQIYTMRMQTMPHELDRNAQGLEELQLTFVQTDTFMPHWI